HPARGDERTVHAARALRDRCAVEQIERAHGDARDLPASPRHRDDRVTVLLEPLHEVRSQKPGRTGDPVRFSRRASVFHAGPAHSAPDPWSWNAFWNVRSKAMLLDLMVPAMNSAGDGV